MEDHCFELVLVPIAHTHDFVFFLRIIRFRFHSYETISCMWCAEFVLRVRKEVERGKLRPDVADNFENLYYNYKNAVNILPVSCLVQIDPYSLITYYS